MNQSLSRGSTRLTRRTLCATVAALFSVYVATPVAAQASGLLDVPVVVYRWATRPTHAAPMLELQLRHADEILLTVVSPRPPLPVVEESCAKPDLFYSLARRTIILCREFAPFVASLDAEWQADAAQKKAIPADTGFVIFLILHETGHALIHQFGLPNIGGSEEAADGFAAWVLLHRRPQAQKPWFADDSSANRLWLLDAVVMFNQLQVRSDRSTAGRRSLDDYLDAHPMAGQRAERLWCYLIGRYPGRRRPVDSDARVQECTALWSELDISWRKTLANAAPRRGKQ